MTEELRVTCQLSKAISDKMNADFQQKDQLRAAEAIWQKTVQVNLTRNRRPEEAQQTSPTV